MDCSHQAPLSMEFPRPEYWSGLPFPSPGHLPNPGIRPRVSCLAGTSFTTEPPWNPICTATLIYSAFLPQFYCECNYSGPHFLSPGLEQWMPTCFPFSIFSVHQHCSQRNLSIMAEKIIISESDSKLFKTFYKHIYMHSKAFTIWLCTVDLPSLSSLTYFAQQ